MICLGLLGGTFRTFRSAFHFLAWFSFSDVLHALRPRRVTDLASYGREAYLRLGTKKGRQKPSFFMVGTTGLEPVTSCM